MKNIFEGAKFGDKYRIDGDFYSGDEYFVFLRHYDYDNAYTLINHNGKEFDFKEDGTLKYITDGKFHISGKWESTDEDGTPYKLALEYEERTDNEYPNFFRKDNGDPEYSGGDIIDAWLEGYNTAKRNS